MFDSVIRPRPDSDRNTPFNFWVSASNKTYIIQKIFNSSKDNLSTGTGIDFPQCQNAGLYDFAGRFARKKRPCPKLTNAGDGGIFNVLSETKDKMQKPLVIELAAQQDYQPLLTGEPMSFGMRSGCVRLEPGKGCPVHSTEGHEEQLVFLAGSGYADIGGKKIPVGKGKVCYIPPHTTHSIHNDGAEPLVYIYCVAPVNGHTT